MALRASVTPFEPKLVEKQTQSLTETRITEAVHRAERRIAPLWPLRHFVAVNPYLGLLEQSFAEAAQTLGLRAGGRMTAPRDFYAQAIHEGRISDEDLAAALDEGRDLSGVPADVAALKAFALNDAQEQSFSVIPTVADVTGEVLHHDWAAFVTGVISQWAGTYFDLGQSYWRSPWSELPPYAAWRAEAQIDRTPEISGVRGFRQVVAGLPDDPQAAIAEMVQRLAIPAQGLDAYLHRLLLTIHGWASYARYHLWEAELRERDDDSLKGLLAIRLAWEIALVEAFGAQGVSDAWDAQKEALANAALDDTTQQILTADLLLQSAFEKAYQRQMIARMAAPQPSKNPARPPVQAAFCIDVRSEVFRRALETVADQADTIGFAGFFGVPIEYVRLGASQGGAQCPALIAPQFVIRESVEGASAAQLAAITAERTITQRVTKAWRSFKFGAVSCFGFVGPVGLVYLKNLVLDTLGYGRPVPDPTTFGLAQDTIRQLKPSIMPESAGQSATGMTAEQRLDLAESILKGMSLTENFARIVLLAGHGSQTVNNPYASGLDCGACGGHSGEANARVAAQILNDREVRTGLQARGITIPDDTIFVAALHNTTTDTVTIFDQAVIPASHAPDIAQLEEQLAAAGQLARAERAALLNINDDANIDQAVMRRSKDWSQVRPEWGLAGCAAFIVAPRDRTRGVDLDGRSFLHSYDWRQDADFSVLELIMTAPMVVASWINLQYYGSTVDNTVFGSGNKTLHNIVGTLGVLEGNGGDLRVGLPWQSVHDGADYVHEPLRLSVMIEAPIDAMNAIIEKHETVRRLVDNGWLHLFALDESGQVAHRYAGDLNWTSC